MTIKWLYYGVLALQAFLYGWALWTYLFVKDSHVPAAYIVIHLVAAANLVVAVSGSLTLFLSERPPPQALWSVLAALPSIGVVAYLFLVKFIHIHR